ncbi:hypothetical protein ABH925_002986 [Streptacidiphilus sp. EB129]
MPGTLNETRRALLFAVCLGPTDGATAVTPVQLRGVTDRLTTAGHWPDLRHGAASIA